MTLMSDILNYAIENGIIDLVNLQQQVEDMRKTEYLKNHDQAIWESNGYWYTHVKTSRGRKLLKRSTRDSLNELIIQTYFDMEVNPTIEECYTQWSKNKLEYQEIQKQTYDRYETDFKRYFVKFGKRKIKDVTDDELYDFCKNTIRDNKLTAKAWGNVRTLIIGTWKYAKRKHFTDLSISQFMGDLDIASRSFRIVRHSDDEEVFTNEELKRLYQQIGQEKPSLLTLGVELALETGIRAGELSALEPGDFVDNCLVISKTEERYKGDDGYIFDVRNSPKGKFGTRKVFLTPRANEIIEMVKEINPDGKYLFEKDGKRMRGKAFSQKCVWLCKKAGIVPKSLHKCRKTYATRLINARVDESLIRSQMGHIDFSTTRGFYYFNNKDEDEARKMVMEALVANSNLAEKLGE